MKGSFLEDDQDPTIGVEFHHVNEAPTQNIESKSQSILNSIVDQVVISKDITPRTKPEKPILSPRHECHKQLIVKTEEGLPDVKVCIEDPNLTCYWLLGEVIR